MLLACVFSAAVINEMTLFLKQKMMIKNHSDVLRELFKGKSIKTWAQSDPKATKDNLMQNELRKTGSPHFIHLIPLSNPSPEMRDSPDEQLKALYHQLPFPSSLGPSPWLLASQLAPMMTLFILQGQPSPTTSCFIITLFDKPFVFFYVPLGVLLRRHEPHTHYESNASAMWWEGPQKVKHGNDSNQRTSVKMTLSSNTTSH